MKNLNITLTDNAFNRLKKAKMLMSLKSPLTWEKFIIMNCAKGVSVKKERKK
jgi:hypothetical protein